MKKQKRPPPRTATSGYFFGAMKAQQTIRKNAGRAPGFAKLPTSINELRESIDKLVEQIDEGRKP